MMKNILACKARFFNSILLLRYDVYDDIVDLSQTFLVVEEVSFYSQTFACVFDISTPTSTQN